MFKPLKTVPLALLAMAGTADALTLGQIHVQSFINEPLKAVIDVNRASADELKALKVKLAEKNAFSKAGIDFTSDIQQLRFELVETPGGTKIQVTTSGAITEPFLSFVIDADWNKGSVSKDYTVLLDPPIYTDRFAAPITPADAGIVRSDEIAAPPEAEQPEKEQVAEQAPEVTETEDAVEEAATKPVMSGEAESFGPTVSGNNLWTVAEAHRPSAATMQQTMVAIHEANPGAFMRGNMNLMKKGQLLRIPPAEVIEAISQVAAENRVQQHQRAWKSGQAVARGERLSPAYEEIASGTATGTDATASVAEAPGGGEPGESEGKSPASDAAKVASTKAAADEGRLQLASAGSSASDAANGDSGEQGAEIDKLRNELISAREEALSAQEESKELSERNKMLEDQLESQKKLIQLQNEQLAKLQEFYRQLNEQREAGEDLQMPVIPGLDAAITSDEPGITEEAETAAPVTEESMPGGETEPPAEETLATETESPLEEEAATTPPVAEETPSQPEEAAAPTETAGAEPQEAAPPAQKTSFLASLMKNDMLVYGGAATGVGILGLLGLWMLRRRRAGADGYDDEDILAAELASAGSDESTPVAAAEQAGAQDDLLERINPLIAYKEFDKAKELLEDAILEEPGRFDLHLKMMDVMYASGDRDGFEEHLKILDAANLEKIDADAWSKVQEQHRDLLARLADDAIEEQQRATEETSTPGGPAKAAAAAASAAVAGAALDKLGAFDEEEEDDLFPGVEEEETLASVEKLDTSLDDVSFEDIDSLPDLEKELAETEFDLGEAEDDESAKKSTVAEDLDLGDQEDLESALKLFEMELEERNTKEAGAVAEEAQEALSETAELLATDDIVKAEEAPEESEIEETEALESLDFSLPKETEQLSESAESEDVMEEPVEELDIQPATVETLPVGEEAGEEVIELPEISEEEVQAKVELAEAFAEMGDVEGAREILDEVMREGNDSQRSTAQEILQKYAS